MSAKSTSGPGGKKPASAATNLIGTVACLAASSMLTEAAQLVVELA